MALYLGRGVVSKGSVKLGPSSVVALEVSGAAGG